MPKTPSSENSPDNKPAPLDDLGSQDGAAPSSPTGGASGEPGAVRGGAAPGASFSAEAQAFFAEKRISLEVAADSFEEYFPRKSKLNEEHYPPDAVENEEPIHRAYGDLGKQAPAMTRKARKPGIKTGKLGGLLIKRFEAPGMGLDPIYPELRPWEAIEDGKYQFAPNPKEEIFWDHDHDKWFKSDGAPHSDYRKGCTCVDCMTRRRKKHARRKKYHKGVDVSGLHRHVENVNDSENGRAKRIGIDPLSLPRFETAEYVDLVAEGELKARTILSEILEDDLPAGVITGMSVTLLDAPELIPVAKMFVPPGVPLNIIVDADWNSPKNKGAVLREALLCRETLREHGINARIQAPPGPEKGADDFRAAGGKRHEYVSIEREAPSDLVEWVKKRGGTKGFAQTVKRLSLLATGRSEQSTKDGHYRAAVEPLGRAMGVPHRHVPAFLGAMDAMGAITIDGSLETVEGEVVDGTPVGGRWAGDYWSGELEWVKRPTIIIAPGLRARNFGRPYEEQLEAVVAEVADGRRKGLTQRNKEQLANERETELLIAKVRNLDTIRPGISDREIARLLKLKGQSAHKRVARLRTKGKEKEEAMNNKEQLDRIEAEVKRIGEFYPTPAQEAERYTAEATRDETEDRLLREAWSVKRPK